MFLVLYISAKVSLSNFEPREDTKNFLEEYFAEGPMEDTPVVAYFSMEIGIEPSIPTYSGGLGVLAGDTIRSAADLEVPMVAVTLLHRRGYFYQRLDERGNQSEEPVVWPIDECLEQMTPVVQLSLNGRKVFIRAWRLLVKGVSAYQIPIYFLDTQLPENEPQDRGLTDYLYGGDQYYRLCQEAILGRGGVLMLRALGYNHIARFHLNEGHAALLVLALFEEWASRGTITAKVNNDVLDSIRDQCVFTTHTPVPAGHDRFPPDMSERVIGTSGWEHLKAVGQEQGLNLTDLALRCSRFVNGVAMKHGQVSQGMFPGYPVHSITNGVHAVKWAAPALRDLYDRHIPDWRYDSFALRYTIGISRDEIWRAHQEAKRNLINYVNQQTNAGFDRDVLTLGFARRSTAYKRATLIFNDLELLKMIAQREGPIQLVFGGKAHPADNDGKDIIRRIHQARDVLRGSIPVAYIENYDMATAQLLVSGSDIWLNTPLPPWEASGTSGMKAAVNGVPSLSILDGWWIEGHVEGATGWAIDERNRDTRSGATAANDAWDASALYEKLRANVIPLYYRDRDRFVSIMRQAISMNASFFNTQRMVWQYFHSAYRLDRTR